jgi:virulence factor Mce-like protein
VATGVALVFGAIALAFALGTDHGSGGYTLRAVFDNGSGLRTGMDVRISGIDVGRVRSIDLDQTVPTMPRAVAIIRITDPRGQDFRRDGSCAIRSATLLGDRFVDCHLAKTHAPGAPLAPPLAVVNGQHLMPVEQTSSPVDPDLLLDIFRLPVRERLSIVINELGTGLAGNGGALHDAIRRADPAFLQLDRTLSILASQRKALAKLADSSDRVLAPLARERQRLGGFVEHGQQLLGAVAQRGDALRATFARLPAFLRQLRPTLRDLNGLAGQAGPVLADLDAAGTRLSDATRSLEPTAREATPGLQALGRAASAQSRGLNQAKPVFSELAKLTPASRPVWQNLDQFLESLRTGGGFDRLTELPMAIGLTANGFDKFGYYERTNAVITTCTSYAVERTSSCVGQFGTNPATAASISSLSPKDARVLDYLMGNDR